MIVTLAKINRKAVLLAGIGVLLAITLPMQFISQASAAPGQVQYMTGSTSSGKIVTSTFSSATKTGDLIAVYVVWSNTGNANVSDNQGNTYVATGAKTTWGSNYSAQVFYAKNTTAGVPTVKATFNNNVSFGVLYAHEYSGLDKVPL